MRPGWFLLPCLLTFCTEPAVSGSSDCPAEGLEVVHEWKYLDYDFDSDEHREHAVASGLYDYRRCVASDVHRWKDKTFVTVLNYPGVPAALNTVCEKTGPGGPLLRPYPDWTWAKNEHCSGIIMVVSIAIDVCDRLWVVDSGGQFDQSICPPQLLTFDLHTSQLLNSMEIPQHIATKSTAAKPVLTGIEVKTSTSNCENFLVFISDSTSPGLIVYDGALMRRLQSSTMEVEPGATTFPADYGKTYELQFGIWPLALSTLTQKLYFSPLSSYSLGVVDTSETERLMSGVGVHFYSYKHIFGTQPTALATSKTGAVFVGLVKDASIGCWNEYRNLSAANIAVITKNQETLQFVTGLKITDYPDQELWALSDRYHKKITKSYNYDEVNFRVLKGNVKCLIKNTVCERGKDY